MTPVNNFNTVNEIFQPYKASALTEKYGLTEQYAKDYPEDFAQVLLLIQSTESALQDANELKQGLEEHSNGMARLRENSEALDARLDSLIESSEKNTQALRQLAKSSSEIKEITSNIAHTVSICTKRFFNPIKDGLQSGFRFLTRHQAPAAIVPREDQLAIEWYPKNTISITDSTNQSSVDEKKSTQIC